MARPKRVLSFFSSFGGGSHGHDSPSSSVPPSPITASSPTIHATPKQDHDPFRDPAYREKEPPSPSTHRRSASIGSRNTSRRNSLAQTYQPPVMEINNDTPPELQPIFSYLNSHSSKLYQEGYFLKLHDLDSRGRPSVDRHWNECFAQLVGTVLSLWDAAQLDAAGEEGEVIPTFINLTDASIKMIQSLPMNGVDSQTLQNVLSISTAANNRYLLHFNSLHSLTQWTAGIRLAMYEHATLQEAYTGSILAGKGKLLNNIKTIMERSRFPTEDWARVRFGAGTPWRRCWCVITPPDEKEVHKAQKNGKKRSAYDRSGPTVKGDIKFYETRTVKKKTQPIATVTNAFSAYAIYPQSRPLIDQSTLVKVEGQVTVHSKPEVTTEGFVFVMPENHAAITGFEMMLRWLIPAFDTFALYGRPHRLVADVLDTRSLMFAMPTQKRYGYLELIDVAGLVHTEGSAKWTEREWRKQMKNLTSKRITSPSVHHNRSDSFAGNNRISRSSFNLPASASSRSSLNLSSSRGIKFNDDNVARSMPGSRDGLPVEGFGSSHDIDSSPPRNNVTSPHRRAASERVGGRGLEPSRLSFEQNQEDILAPQPPPHGPPGSRGSDTEHYYSAGEDEMNDNSGREQVRQNGSSDVPTFQNGLLPVGPVALPPQMMHQSGQKPSKRPVQRPDLARANSAIDAETLAQLAEASRPVQQYQPAPNMTNNYGPPQTSNGGRRGQPEPNRKLATIPGTPAFEADNFNLPIMTKVKSRDGTMRKPVPGISPERSPQRRV